MKGVDYTKALARERDNFQNTIQKDRAYTAKTIKDAKVTGTITITGHTDSTASDRYNLALSTRRAKAVAAALEPLIGSGVTLKTTGKGETEPDLS